MSADNQAASFSAGDTVSLRFPISDSSGASPASLSAPAAYWKMRTPSGQMLKDSDLLGGVRVIEEVIASVNWFVAYVDFIEADTIAISGRYNWSLRIIDGSRKLITASGTLLVKPW